MKKTSKDYIFVFIQFLLFGAYTFDFFQPLVIPKQLATLGMVIAFIGFMIALLTVFELKTNLTVFPTPTQKAVLLTHGFFRYSRHPIYSGILMVAFGYALYKYSIYKLLIAGLLFIWFYLKSSYEEKQLAEKFNTYKEYQENVGRFFPKIK
ncbi:methyltransferase family protein [Flavobacterium lacus]|uniref:Protein-S-isoprenylcysteine O-methyltransferase Ste14 n=1 Tax=Flavobacterium lacus TaxID=1353778 RepID=A0A328WS85_9FLAO|nr:isoprenylcysteine carboxylmethyltransferase family protein [Flavobacterium lacus]RAR49013.1 protein-S-isoprenylcysteine O-methyltransferase Ste14 [Flavobacterium lacus]